MNTIEPNNEVPNNDAVALAEKVVNEDAKKKKEEKWKKTSEKIKKILEEDEMALQLSLSITPAGILPMANLVELPKKKEEVKEEIKTDDK